MALDKSGSLQWGKGTRPTSRSEIGTPNPSEGSNGDIQLRNTNIGARLFGKVGGKWLSINLSSTKEMRLGINDRKQIFINSNGFRFGANSATETALRIANDGSMSIGTSTTKKVNIAATGVLTVSDIELGGYITLNDANDNVVIGKEIFGSGTDDSHNEKNLCIGYRAAYNLHGTGSYKAANNVAIGYEALYNMAYDAATSSATCSNNVAVGYQTMKNWHTGQYNIGIGQGALQGASSGDVTGQYNVGLGDSTCPAITSGDKNICIGSAAGVALTTGDNNICIGYASSFLGSATADRTISIGETSSCSGDYGIAMGYLVQAATNDFSFGKVSNVVTNDFDADAAWSRSSDLRKKTNIQNDTLGLSFVNNLRTVTFKWKPANEHPEEWEAWTLDADSGEKIYHEMNTSTTMHGLIAQEVKSALDTEGVTTFGGWKESSKGEQSLSSEMFVFPLIKAVQELSEKIDAMQIEINNLK